MLYRWIFNFFTYTQLEKPWNIQITLYKGVICEITNSSRTLTQTKKRRYKTVKYYVECNTGLRGQNLAILINNIFDEYSPKNKHLYIMEYVSDRPRLEKTIITKIDITTIDNLISWWRFRDTSDFYIKNKNKAITIDIFGEKDTKLVHSDSTI